MANIKVKINDQDIIAKPGTSIEQLLVKAKHKGPFEAIGAVVNSRLVGLYYKIKADSEVRTIDFSDREGMDIYRRSASFILYSAVNDINSKAKVTVGQSLSDGYFFEIHNAEVDKTFVSELEERMRYLIEKDLPLYSEWKTIEEAIAILDNEQQQDKVLLLRQLRRSDFPIISLGDYHGCAYGPIARRTGLINRFAIYPYEHGLVLAFPDENGEVPKSIPAQPKLFNTYLETKRWDSLMEVENVSQLNEQCINGRISELVKVAEGLHERKIINIADEIMERKDTRLVLIAGPSGSGKTTFMKRLAIQFRIHGIEPVTISLDNYYMDRESVPRHADGLYNFEDIKGLDVDLLNQNLCDLMKGKEVQIPSYSFVLGKREEGVVKRIALHKNQALIVEGIHGLNDALTPSIDIRSKFKIFVSALTQLCIDDHNRIFTTDTRLIRRIVRDRFFRGTSAAETIQGWPSVRKGEGKYIFPYQEGADAVFNSALIYEHALLKPYAERFLMEVPREHPSFMESARLTKFFSYFIPILSREMPHNSILREFIGGSAFKYN